MSETNFVLFQNTVGGIGIILYACCLAAFFRPFMAVRKGRDAQKALKMFIVFFAYAAVYFVNMAVSAGGWICMIAVTVLLAIVSGYLGIHRKFSILIGVLFFAIRNLCTLAAASVNFYMGRHFVQGEEEVGKILRNTAFNLCLVELLQIMLFTALLYTVGRQIRKCSMELHIRELCYLLLIPFTGLLFVSIIFRILIVISGDLVIQLYEQYPVLAGIVPVTAALFYAGILVTIVSYQRMVGFQEEKKKYFVEQQQVHAIQERMEEVEQFYDGYRRMKHEMRNHLTNIKGLFESGNFGEMEKYIAKMDEGMDVPPFAVKTGNAVTDVIVNDKQKAADRQGTAFRSDFIYPKSDRYNAYDIGIIVNNLLQNALEACSKVSEGGRYISVSSRQKRKFFLIEVKNSFEGEIVMDADTDLPMSTKGDRNDSLHGIGLSNVKREAEKYMGDVDIKVKKNEFSVTVMLQERRQE